MFNIQEIDADRLELAANMLKAGQHAKSHCPSR
jgi:hypothetical protein